MTLAEFETLFKGTMVHMNWDRAKRERWRVSTSIVTTREELASLRAVWTTGGIVGDHGRRVQLDHGVLASVASAWRIKILRLAMQFEEDGGPIVLALPACQGVVLDGNHRAAALAIARVPFRILLCSITPRDGVVWGSDDWLL